MSEDRIDCFKIWVDDERPVPKGYDAWAKSVYDALTTIASNLDGPILLDMDHDAGEQAKWGGDFIKILEYIEHVSHELTIEGDGVVEEPWCFVKFHSANPVGVANMRRIVEACSDMKEV